MGEERVLGRVGPKEGTLAACGGRGERRTEWRDWARNHLRQARTVRNTRTDHREVGAAGSGAAKGGPGPSFRSSCPLNYCAFRLFVGCCEGQPLCGVEGCSRRMPGAVGNYVGSRVFFDATSNRGEKAKIKAKSGEKMKKSLSCFRFSLMDWGLCI